MGNPYKTTRNGVEFAWCTAQVRKAGTYKEDPDYRYDADKGENYFAGSDASDIFGILWKEDWAAYNKAKKRKEGEQTIRYQANCDTNFEFIKFQDGQPVGETAHLNSTGSHSAEGVPTGKYSPDHKVKWRRRLTNQRLIARLTADALC